MVKTCWLLLQRVQRQEGGPHPETGDQPLHLYLLWWQMATAPLLRAASLTQPAGQESQIQSMVITFQGPGMRQTVRQISHRMRNWNDVFKTK